MLIVTAGGGAAAALPTAAASSATTGKMQVARISRPPFVSVLSDSVTQATTSPKRSNTATASAESKATTRAA